MGEQRVGLADAGRRLRTFMQAVLRDLDALRFMLDQGLLESGVRRIRRESR